MSLIFALIIHSAIAGATNNPTTTGPTSGSAPPQPPSSGCTTLEPIFGYPADGTSTVFITSTTTTSPVDCRGCTPTTRLFNYSITDPPPTPTTTITNTKPLTIFEFSCLPTAFPSATISSTPSTTVTPTASPVPPVDAEGQELIDELRTVNLYVALIANGGFADVSCSAINPPALSNNTGINGTAVQNEVCFAASIQAINPPLYPLVVQGNQIGLQKFAGISLYAVQVAAGYGGVTATKSDLEKLYEEIDEESLNALFIGYIPEEGTRVKNYVRNAAKRKI